LYPPAWSLFVRAAVRDTKLGGFRVRKGDWIFIYPWLLHRDERFFERPLEFDPDRFQGDRMLPAARHAHIPFGLGAHTCIGASLSNLLMTTWLLETLRHWRLTAIQPEPIGRERCLRDVVIRPKKPVRVDVQPRNPLRSGDAG